MEEEKRRIIPQALEFNGVPVVTSKQLTELYHCTRQNIDGIFRKHNADFIEGTDYFKLVGEDLKELKARFARQFELPGARQLYLAADGSEKIPPFSGSASALYVWTKSGAFKLAEYIGTDEAKMVYAGLAMAYFSQNKPKQLQLFKPSAPVADSKKFENACNFLDKITAFLKESSAIEDKNLRDDLIRAALNLLQ